MAIVPPYPPRKTSGIYSLTQTATLRTYVGSAVDIRRRWQAHLSDLRGGHHRNSYLQRAWNKYGEDAFQFAILELTTVDRLQEREQYWIDELHAADKTTGFNLGLVAGAAMLGRKHTPETRHKLSIIQKQRQKSDAELRRFASLQKGVKWTDEQRAQKSAAQRGRKMPPRTEEWKRQQSERQSGRKLSPEHSDHIRQALRTRHAQPGSHLARIYIVTTPTGEDLVVYNLSAFCREHDLYAPSMRKIAAGRLRRHKGWTCRYKP